MFLSLFTMALLKINRTVYLPFAEYIAFCHPISCQESITFLISHLTAYRKRAEDEQAGDVTGELQVHLFFPCEIMFTI